MINQYVTRVEAEEKKRKGGGEEEEEEAKRLEGKSEDGDVAMMFRMTRMVEIRSRYDA